MNVSERMRALLDGKKIRRCDWLPTSYIYMKKGMIVTDTSHHFTSIDITSPKHEWEIYVKPEQKISLTWSEIEEAIRATSIHDAVTKEVGLWWGGLKKELGFKED